MRSMEKMYRTKIVEHEISFLLRAVSFFLGCLVQKIFQKNCAAY